MDFGNLDFDGYSVISAYFPSGSTGDHRQQVKFEFLTYFKEYIVKLRETIPNLIICGDYNICHREIDPLGFVLENYDPIGRWRTNYPKYREDEEGGKSKRIDGLAVDTSGTLPCGTKLNDVTDLKKFLSENPEPFARCISEKLMTYATGRQLNYRERALIAEIVKEQSKHDLRFRDLLLALVDSEIFRTK